MVIAKNNSLQETLNYKSFFFFARLVFIKQIAKGTEGQQTTNKKEETTTITFYRITFQIICEISQGEGRTWQPGYIPSSSNNQLFKRNQHVKFKKHHLLLKMILVAFHMAYLLFLILGHLYPIRQPVPKWQIKGIECIWKQTNQPSKNTWQ